MALDPWHRRGRHLAATRHRQRRAACFTYDIARLAKVKRQFDVAL
jgi:hypothetical protein